MPILEAQKKTCLRNCRRVKRCTRAIGCFIWEKPELVIFSFWMRDMCRSMKNQKNIKALSGQQRSK